MMNTSQVEYIRRINKVIDYIDQNLEKELNLELLSGIANFSPFHFHRIFSAITGETLNNFVKRLRLERAGSLLISEKENKISDIAYICGFNSVAVFCRSFKKHFHISAGQFRDSWQDKYQIKKDFNNAKVRYFNYEDEISKWRGEKGFEIKINNMPALNLIYCRYKGPFNQINKAYNKLMKWAGARGLLNFPETKTVTVYHDDPNITTIENLRQSACITVGEEIKPEGEFGKLILPAGKYAVGNFTINVNEFENAWDSMCIWLSESGYQPAQSFPYELYHDHKEVNGEHKFNLDICIPVKPL